VLRFSDAHPDMRIALILPTAMLGPGDVGPAPTAAFVLKLLRGKLESVLPGWHRTVDARDAALAVTEVSGTPTPTKPTSAGKRLLVSRPMSLARRLARRPLSATMDDTAGWFRSRRTAEEVKP